MIFAPKKTLCLLDLSPISANVLNWTRLFAEKFGSAVEVLHVIWPPTPRQLSEEESEALAADFEVRRNELRRGIRVMAGEALGPRIHYEVAVGVGHPVRVVLERISEVRPDLIVLGAHGHDGMARSLLGSVAENVVRETAFPSLVVKGAELAPQQAELDCLLCPVDLTKFGAQCVDLSASLTAEFRATLDVLRVTPDAPSGNEAALEEFRQWLPEVIRKRCPVSEVVRHGDAGEQIIAYARQHEVDLIIVGAEHRKFLEFTVLGRTTERVVRHGPCSVLLLCLEAD